MHEKEEEKFKLSFKIIAYKILWILGIVALVFLILFGFFQSSLLIFLTSLYKVLSYTYRALSLVNFNPIAFSKKIKERLFQLQTMDFNTLKALLKEHLHTIYKGFTSYDIKENKSYTKPSSGDPNSNKN